MSKALAITIEADPNNPLLGDQVLENTRLGKRSKRSKAAKLGLAKRSSKHSSTTRNTLTNVGTASNTLSRSIYVLGRGRGRGRGSALGGSDTPAF